MKIALFLLGLIVASLFWFVATDMLYAVLSWRFDLIEWPFTLWLNDFPSRNYSDAVRLRWWGAAIVPALLLLKALWDARARLWPAFTGLYGVSRTATRKEMRQQGIYHTRNLFK